ncbi:MAG: helix-turn-helix domain-containing protein [Rhodococcus sp.]|nr:helix-turn-helix domain-containing protein [Rhodococcus sp. (in: high G+C Gram-positive bacteria)]
MAENTSAGIPAASVPPKPERDVDLYRRAVATLRSSLPDGWTIASAKSPTLSAAPERMLVTAPTGEVASFQVITARGVLAGDAAKFADGLAASDRGFVCARYLSDPVRRQLDARGLSYADATGNVSVFADRPAIWVRDRGADADPWRGPGRPPAQLTGDPAARVVRALADHTGAVTVPELIALAGASTGATYRVVETLAERELIERAPRGPISRVRWIPMLRAWSSDSSFSDCQSVGFVAPDGLDAALARLAQVSEVYSVTGSHAAAVFTEYGDLRQLHIYADDPDTLARSIGLRAVEDGATVLVATPRSPVVFDRTVLHDGVRMVSPTQAFADLLAGSGRQPDEAERLLEWMKDHESTWRVPVGVPA